jgi:hypothetical protein
VLQHPRLRDLRCAALTPRSAATRGTDAAISRDAASPYICAVKKSVRLRADCRSLVSRPRASGLNTDTPTP